MFSNSLGSSTEHSSPVIYLHPALMKAQAHQIWLAPFNRASFSEAKLHFSHCFRQRTQASSLLPTTLSSMSYLLLVVNQESCFSKKSGPTWWDNNSFTVGNGWQRCEQRWGHTQSSIRSFLLCSKRKMAAQEDRKHQGSCYSCKESCICFFGWDMSKNIYIKLQRFRSCLWPS